MKKLFLILTTTLALTSCGSNPLENTQWKSLNGTEIDMMSFDKDTCCIYGKSPSTGKTYSIGMRYHVNDGTLSFSPLKIHFESQPTYKIDGEFLIDTKSNVPTFQKVK